MRPRGRTWPGRPWRRFAIAGPTGSTSTSSRSCRDTRTSSWPWSGRSGPASRRSVPATTSRSTRSGSRPTTPSSRRWGRPPRMPSSSWATTTGRPAPPTPVRSTRSTVLPTTSPRPCRRTWPGSPRTGSSWASRTTAGPGRRSPTRETHERRAARQPATPRRSPTTARWRSPRSTGVGTTTGRSRPGWPTGSRAAPRPAAPRPGASSTTTTRRRLRARYDMVNLSGIRGVGIWALGYDGTRPELYKALADKFLTDTTPPLAGIVMLPAVQGDEGFGVSWTGIDDWHGVASYDLQVSTDGGPWLPWISGTQATTDVWLGADGHAYSFRVRARDGVGNLSGWNVTSVYAAAPVLAAGGFGRVTASQLNVRSAPGTSATQARLGGTRRRLRHHRRPVERRRVHVVPGERPDHRVAAGGVCPHQRLDRGKRQRLLEHGGNPRPEQHDGRGDPCRHALRVGAEPRGEHRGGACGGRGPVVLPERRWLEGPSRDRLDERAHARQPGSPGLRPGREPRWLAAPVRQPGGRRAGDDLGRDAGRRARARRKLRPPAGRHRRGCPT